MYKSLESTIKEVLAEANANSEHNPKLQRKGIHAKTATIRANGMPAGTHYTSEPSATTGGKLGSWDKNDKAKVFEEETPVEPKDMPKPGQKQLLDQKKTETKADTESPPKKNSRRDAIKLHPDMEENPEPKPKESLREGTAHGSHGKAVDGLWDDGFRVQSVNFTHSIGNTPTPRPGQGVNYITKMKHARTGEELTVHTRKTALGHKTSIMEDAELDEGFFDGKKKNRGLIPDGGSSKLRTKAAAAYRNRKLIGSVVRSAGRNSMLPAVVGNLATGNYGGAATMAALHIVHRNNTSGLEKIDDLKRTAKLKKTRDYAAGRKNDDYMRTPNHPKGRDGMFRKGVYNESSVYQLGLMQLQEDDTESFKLPSEQSEGLDESIAAALLAGGAIGLIASAGIRGKGRKSRGAPHKGRKQYGVRAPRNKERAKAPILKKPAPAMNASAPSDHDDTTIRHARFQRLGILPTRSPGRTGIKNYISRDHYLTLKRMHNSGASDKQLVKAHKELKHKFPLAANRSNAAGAHFMTHVHEARLSRKKSDEQLMAMIKKINPNRKDDDPTIGIKGSMGFEPKRGPQTKYSRLYRSQK